MRQEEYTGLAMLILVVLTAALVAKGLIEEGLML